MPKPITLGCLCTCSRLRPWETPEEAIHFRIKQANYKKSIKQKQKYVLGHRDRSEYRRAITYLEFKTPTTKPQTDIKGKYVPLTGKIQTTKSYFRSTPMSDVRKDFNRAFKELTGNRLVKTRRAVVRAQFRFPRRHKS